MVGIADALGIIMWTKYFMEVQGYSTECNILFQDNQSTILIAKNGRSLAGKKSKHIKNRYFLITDKVHQEDLEIRYKTTCEMLAEYQSNPQQGKLFQPMRSQLMNFHIDYNDNEEHIKTHRPSLPKIEAGTKGEELKKNTVGDSMKINKIVLKKNQAVDGNAVHKAA